MPLVSAIPVSMPATLLHYYCAQAKIHLHLV